LPKCISSPSAIGGQSCLPKMAPNSAIKVLIALLYLGGVILLLPGFLWIVPKGVFQIHKGPVTIAIPLFTAKYASGVHLLIAGISLVSSAALLEFFQTCHATLAAARVAGPASGSARRLLPSASRAGVSGCAATMSRLLGPGCQVLGSLAILAGCVIFLPKFSLAVPPVKIAGMKAPDLGKLLFQLGSAAYFLGAVAAIRGLVAGACAGRQPGWRSWQLAASLLAFLLFMLTSSMLLSSGLLAPVEAVRAGHLRVAGAVCLLVGVVLLSAVTASEVLSGRSDTAAASTCADVGLDGCNVEAPQECV